MKYILSKDVSLVGSSPKDYDHSVGFHDIKPFNSNNDDLLLVHRFPIKNILFSNKIETEICLWNYKNSKIQILDKTSAWSWEQGSRLQWIDENTIVYNKVNKNKLGCVINNINNNNKKFIDRPIYSLSKNNEFLSLNFPYLWNVWKNYGYYLNETIDFRVNKDFYNQEGIFLCDFKNNSRLILSIADAIKICGLQRSGKKFFLAHPTFSPDGNKFLTLLRYFSDDNNLISYLIYFDYKNNSHKILAKERVSHFEWLDNNTIVVWARKLPTGLQNIRSNFIIEKYLISNLKKLIKKLNPGLKKKILSTHYYIIKINDDNKSEIINNNLLDVDGHPQISHDGKYLIFDTYADELNYQSLILYNLKNKKSHLLAKFRLDTYLNQKKLKYDLHPRWNKKGNLINFDSSHDGSRQTYVLNIENYVD